MKEYSSLFAILGVLATILGVVVVLIREQYKYKRDSSLIPQRITNKVDILINDIKEIEEKIKNIEEGIRNNDDLDKITNDIQSIRNQANEDRKMIMDLVKSILEFSRK